MTAAAAELLRRLDGFVQEARAREVLMPDALRPIGDALHAAQTDGIDRPIDKLLVIMLCGPTAAGKSSLLNALAGAEIAPVGLGATTDAPLVYVHDDDDPARLFGYGQELGVVAAGGAGLVRHARAGLRHRIIVDTPDIDSAVRSHRAVTEAAVASADIVLYVTSPEKYKVEEPLRWLAAHRARHGLAFVLNKWDAAGMGMQFARRQEVADDFAALIAELGFSDPHLFTVSVRDGPGSDGARGFAGLRAWLTEQLDTATATAVGALRRRAAWGELAAALDVATNTLAGTRDDIRDIARAWNDAAAAAASLLHAAAARLAMPDAPPGYRPQSPGVYGLLRGFVRRPRRMAAGTAPAAHADPFGAAALPGLGAAARELEVQARTRHLPLGLVPARWADILAALAQELAEIPARAEADVVAASLHAPLRRFVAALWLGMIEGAIAAALALTLWRLVIDFLAGRYAPFPLLGNAAAIVALVALFGEAGMRLLFPGLSHRLVAAARRRARLRLDAAVASLVEAITAQIEATIGLRETGTELRAVIGRETGALTATAAEGRDAARLFATSPGVQAAHASARFD